MAAFQFFFRCHPAKLVIYILYCEACLLNENGTLQYYDILNCSRISIALEENQNLKNIVQPKYYKRLTLSLTGKS